MICGRLAPPPAGYAVSHHWVKNWSSFDEHAALWFGQVLVVLRLHLGLGDVAAAEVVLGALQRVMKRSSPRIWRSASYDAPGRAYVGGLSNSESGVGFDGTSVQNVPPSMLYVELNWVTRLASKAALPAGVP